MPYVVTALATNATGTQASCTFEVTVNDMPPTIVCPVVPNTECTGPMGAAVPFVVTANDDWTSGGNNLALI